MNTISLPIRNRDFQLPADGKIHCVPLGEFPVEHQGKTLVQVVDERACDAMIANFQRDALEPDFGGLCCDYEHFRHDPDKGSPAAAWIESIEKRADGIYAMPRLTNSGRKALEGGEYKGISPEFDPKTLVPLGGNRFRVTRLVGFGLTNVPNMKGMRPLTNRLEAQASPAETPAHAQAHASLVSHLAQTLRDADKALTLHQSYARAARALNPEQDAAGSLVIANRARVLRDADKHLSVAESYRLAQDTKPLTNRLVRTSPVAGMPAPINSVSVLAQALRDADKALTLHQSYTRAARALNPEQDAAGSLVIANRARQLRDADKHLSLADSYRLAQAE